MSLFCTDVMLSVPFICLHEKTELQAVIVSADNLIGDVPS